MAHIGAVLSAPWIGAFVWTLVASSLRTEARERGLELSYRAVIETSDQALMINELLDLGVDALIFHPKALGEAELSLALDRALAAGVPVITLDSVIAHPAVVCSVGTDNDAAQAQAAEYAFQQIGHRGRVVHFQGDQRLPVGVARNRAFHRVLSKYPALELVDEAMLDWVAPRSRVDFGAERMRAIFAAGLRPDVVISASDEGAQGAIQVITEQGLQGKVIVTGFDGLSEAMLLIREGRMLATIRQMPALIAQGAFDAVQAALSGKPLLATWPVRTEMITRDTVVDAAIDALRQVPQFIYDMSQGHHVQRELQQAVIEKQNKILGTVAAVSNVFGLIREPQAMMQGLAQLLHRDFGLHSAVIRPSTDHALFEACHQLSPGPASSGAAVLLLPLRTSGKLLGEVELRSHGPKPPDRLTVAVLEAIAHQGAIALESANLYAQTVRLAISELRETEARLALAQRAEYLSYHDTLTELPNRRMLNKLLEQAIAQAHRYGRRLAVLFLDLDRFKQVNDTMGHEAGDKLLQEAALRLKGCLRDSDTVARLGGDEFVVLLPALSAEYEPATVAQKIIAAIGRPFALSGHAFNVTASVGIAVYPDDGIDEPTLTKNADVAMYHAKKEGRNNHQFYSSRLNANSLERLMLEAGLRRALAEGEFRLHYQPKRDTETERISGVEVLLRWQHPELGLLAPLQFLSVAEEIGLIVPIGKWVIRTACALNIGLQQEGIPPLVMSVNLTQRQFNDDGLVADLLAILAETGMPAHLLELEIHEKTLLQNDHRTLSVLTRLKEQGIRIAIDDFGLGYSSLSTLKRFPLDTIKIDRSLIRGVTNAHDENLAEAIIAMGRALSLTIVAQGVETREQADYLRQHACNEFQGFYFNEPVPSDRLAEVLKVSSGQH